MPEYIKSGADPSCDSPNSSRRFALGTSDVFLAWSVKTRRAPSRHCRDARVYGHTTTAIHDNEYSPPLPRPTVEISSKLPPARAGGSLECVIVFPSWGLEKVIRITASATRSNPAFLG